MPSVTFGWAWPACSITYGTLLSRASRMLMNVRRSECGERAPVAGAVHMLKR